MSKKIDVLIMAGGTGGHVFPGLAVADALRNKGLQVAWLGTKKGMEAWIVPKHNIELHFINIAGIRGKGWLNALLAPYKMLVAFCSAIQLLIKLRPALVIGMGGFVAGPGGIAAWVLRIPLVIQEQNAYIGTTNKILSYFASRIYTGFPNLFLHLPIKKQKNVLFTGNTVRQSFLNHVPPETRFQAIPARKRLLIVGGSRGAKILNSLVPEALSLLPKEIQFEVCHQTGAGGEDITKNLYKKYNIQANVQPFIDDMPQAYLNAEIVICRAGALTLAELMCIGVGSILIPFPFAIDDHQTINAQYLCKAGAAILAPQAMLTAKKLSQVLSEILPDNNRLLQMAEQAYALASRDALTRIVNDVMPIIKLHQAC